MTFSIPCILALILEIPILALVTTTTEKRAVSIPVLGALMATPLSFATTYMKLDFILN